MDILSWALLLAGGVAAGAINTMAGGGTLLTFPLLVLVGLPPNVANGTNRVAVFVQSVVATRTFHKRGLSGVTLGAKLLPAGLIGAALGTYLATITDPDLFRQIFGLAMIPLAAVIFLRKKPSDDAHLDGSKNKSLMIAYFFVGLYAGFIQAGVGMLALTALSMFGGLGLIQANAVKVLTISAFALVSIVIFSLADDIAWGHGIVLSLATGLGGCLGTIAVIRQGDKLIRAVFLVTAIGLSIRMIVG